MLEEHATNLYSNLRRYDYAYYVDSSPIVEDSTYDKLKRELKETEVILGIDGNYSNNLGFVVSPNLEKKPHPTKMWSMQDVFKMDEFLDWEKKYNLTEEPLHLSLKMDGLSLNLIYENGFLVDALTRGDKQTGQSVHKQALQVKGIPIFVDEFVMFSEIEVRGEVQMRKSEISKINERENSSYKSARNLASGTLMSFDTKVVASRNLIFVPFGVGQKTTLLFEKYFKFTTFTEILLKLQSIFPIHNEFTSTEYTHTQESLSNSLKFCEIMRERDDLAPVDGMVIQVDSLKKRREMDFSESYPNYQLAYKFGEIEYLSKIKEVVWGGSQSGTLSPVAVLADPFDAVDGSLIENVTLNNPAWIELNNIKEDSVLTIIKSGAIIPKVIRVDGNDCITKK